MYDKTEQTEDVPYSNKIAAPTTLGQLLQAQEATKSLLNDLSERLESVADHRPVEAKDRAIGGGYHISTALDTQHEINDKITYIFDTIVV